MNETDTIARWVAERRERAPAPDPGFSGDVMARVCAVATVPTVGERIAAAVKARMPARRHGAVYLGGGAFAGAFRVGIILYLVLGVY